MLYLPLSVLLTSNLHRHPLIDLLSSIGHSTGALQPKVQYVIVEYEPSAQQSVASCCYCHFHILYFQLNRNLQLYVSHFDSSSTSLFDLLSSTIHSMDGGALQPRVQYVLFEYESGQQSVAVPVVIATSISYSPLLLIILSSRHSTPDGGLLRQLNPRCVICVVFSSYPLWYIAPIDSLSYESIMRTQTKKPTKKPKTKKPTRKPSPDP